MYMHHQFSSVFQKLWKRTSVLIIWKIKYRSMWKAQHWFLYFWRNWIVFIVILLVFCQSRDGNFHSFHIVSTLLLVYNEPWWQLGDYLARQELRTGGSEGQPGQPGEELQQEQGAGGSGQELLPSKHHDGPLDTLTAHCSVQCYRVLKISKNL